MVFTINTNERQQFSYKALKRQNEAGIDDYLVSNAIEPPTGAIIFIDYQSTTTTSHNWVLIEHRCCSKYICYLSFGLAQGNTYTSRSGVHSQTFGRHGISQNPNSRFYNAVWTKSEIVFEIIHIQKTLRLFRTFIFINRPHNRLFGHKCAMAA